jgi:hypothetical protein
MSKLADLVEQHTEELAALDGADAGKLLLLGKMIDIPAATQMLRYYAGAADKIHGDVLRVSGKYQGYTLKEPIGVVGVIIPWNFPTMMFFLKVSPALAAGCSVVVKPAEQTPLSALYYAHLAKLAGVPDGVINVVPGFGPTAGAALTSHMDVDSVSTPNRSLAIRASLNHHLAFGWHVFQQDPPDRPRIHICFIRWPSPAPQKWVASSWSRPRGATLRRSGWSSAASHRSSSSTTPTSTWPSTCRGSPSSSTRYGIGGGRQHCTITNDDVQNCDTF